MASRAHPQTIGCVQVLLIALLLGWVGGVPPLLALVFLAGHPGPSWAFIAATAGALVVPLLAVLLPTRGRAAWLPVTSTASALLALSGFLVLDLLWQSLFSAGHLLAALPRLGLLSGYTLLAALWAPRLAGLGPHHLARVLGLERLRLGPLCLALALAALLTLPWPLSGALGDRFASMELALQSLALLLPETLLFWGLVYFLFRATWPRLWVAVLAILPAYGAFFAAARVMAPVETLLQYGTILLPLVPLLAELRARDSGIYPLLLLAWPGHFIPILFVDPRSMLPAGEPELLHLASYAGIALIALTLALFLFTERHLRRLLRRQRRRPLLPGSLVAAASVVALLVALGLWGGLYLGVGVPGFADDGLLVILREQADLSGMERIPNREERLGAVYVALVETAERTQAPLRTELDSMGVAYRPYYIVNMVRVEGRRDLLDYLAGRPEVAQVILNPNVRRYPRHGSLVGLIGEVPGNGVEPNLQAIGAEQAWALGARGGGIIVAGQDTGYDWTHPALQAAYRGWDGLTASHDYNWHDAWDGTAEPFDEDGHGTHTMGTILGEETAGDNRIGVAPQADWIGCRNMRRGLGNPGAYIECMEFFLAPYPHGGDPFRDGDVTMSPHVINNSWGCPDSEGCAPGTLEQAVEVLRAAGIMMVVSAGNDGPACSTAVTPPANYDAVFSVGATDLEGESIAYFSSRGPVGGLLKPDISAPGDNIRSCLPRGGYTSLSGTSMAGPHVTGVVALVWSAQPQLIGQIDATESLLCLTAQPRRVDLVCQQGAAGGSASGLEGVCACGGLKGTPNNVFGCGLVDAAAAVRAALGR